VCGEALKALRGSWLRGQQLRFSGGGGSVRAAGMPGALRPGQSRGFACCQTQQPRAVVLNLDHVSWEEEQGTEGAGDAASVRGC